MLNNNEAFKKAIDNRLKHVVITENLKDKIRADAYSNASAEPIFAANKANKRTFTPRYIVITAACACLVVAVSLGIYFGTLPGFGRQFSSQSTASVPAAETVLPPANAPDDAQTVPTTPDAVPSFVSPPILVDIPPPNGVQPVPSEVDNTPPSEHLQAEAKTSKVFL